MKVIAQIKKSQMKGFTLVELLLSVTITVILLGILLNLTGSSISTLDRAQSKVLLSKKADTCFEVLAEDIESMVIRRDEYDWFFAGMPQSNQYGGTDSPTHVKLTDRRVSSRGDLYPPNIATMSFLTADRLRYDGYAGTDTQFDGEVIDKGGDVSYVGYRLLFINPMNNLDGVEAASLSNETRRPREEIKMCLHRETFNPEKTYDIIASNADSTILNRAEAHASTQQILDFTVANALSTNVYGMSAVFDIEYTDSDGAIRSGVIILKPFADKGTRYEVQNEGPNVATFVRISDQGRLISNAPAYFEDDSSVTADRKLKKGDQFMARSGFTDMKIIAVTVTLTLLDETGDKYIQNAHFNRITPHMDRRELIEKHGYSFSRRFKFPDY